MVYINCLVTEANDIKLQSNVLALVCAKFTKK